MRVIKKGPNLEKEVFFKALSFVSYEFYIR